MMSKSKKQSWWQYIIFGSVLLFLYASGLMPEVIGFVQRGVLKTGLMNPNTEVLMANNLAMADSTELIEQDGEYTKAEYNFKLRDENGKVISLSDFEGKHIFMNFWATWCPPCIAEMPSINEAYNEMNEDVVFVMISTDDSFKKAKDFKAKRNFNFPIYQIAGPIPKLYQENSLPTTYIIDSKGNLAFKHIGMADYSHPEFKKFMKSLL